MSTASIDTDVMWPRYAEPKDLPVIEAVPLAERGLPATTYELLRHAAALRPDAVALTVMPDAAHWRESVAVTFTELLAETHRLANTLAGLGVGRADAVTILSPNCVELVPAVLAAQLAGIAAPVNGSLVAAHVRHLMERSGSRIIIAAGPELDPAGWNTVIELASAGLLDQVLVLRPTGAPDDRPPLPDLGEVPTHYFADLAAGAPSDRFVGAPPVGADIAALFHTGGTTGLPKLAAHTHTNEVVDAWMVAANNLLDEDSKIFAALPLFHVNALIVTVLAPLFKAQGAVWAGPLGYRDADLFGCFWQIVEHHGISTMSAVPTVYAVLAQCPVDADISCMKFAMVGASALPDAVRAGFEKHTAIPLLEGYGLTEATCASVRSYPHLPVKGSVGQRFPYQDVKAVHIAEDGEWIDLPRGESGVLAISGPTVFAGYVTGRDEHGLVLDPLGKIVDGWLDTGDLGWVDESDFVHLTGRAKDLIIRGGHNIDPAVIEDALLSHPAVTSAGAVGEPDEHSGEVPVAFVTLAADANVTPEELKTWATESVAERAAAPRSVTVLDALPVTDVGKPYKLELRARAAQRVICERLAEVSGVEQIEAPIEDGSVTVVVTVSSADAEAEAAAILSLYAMPSRVVTLS